MRRRWLGLVLLIGMVWSIATRQSHADISTALIAHWSMNAGIGTTIADSSASCITLTFGAGGQAPTWLTPGRVGAAAVTCASASNQYAQAGITTGSPLYVGSSNFTVAAWVKRAASGANHGVVGIWDDGGAPYWYVRLDASNTIRVVLSTAESGTNSFDSTSTITDTNWHHIAVAVTRGGTADFYLDGSAVGTPSVAGVTGSITGGAGRNVAICNLGDINSAFAFGGSLDDVRVYSRALNSADVTELYAFTEASRRRHILLE
jgi:hypothetical protein